MERRAADRIETRFEVVWVAGSTRGEGALRNLSQAGAWIFGQSVPPAMGAKIRAVILNLREADRMPVLLEGVVARRTSAGFAVEFDLARGSEIASLLDRLAKADALPVMEPKGALGSRSNRGGATNAR